jgi:hypothetical protein
MKIKQGYELVEIMNEWMVVPIGENMIKVEGLFSLSESSAFLWKQLRVEQNYDDLLSLFLAEYEIDRRTAELDINEFVGNLDRMGLLEGIEITGK